MDRIVIDAALASKIQLLTGPTELVDGTGHVVAVVDPRVDPAQYDLEGEDLSPDEIDRRCQPGRRHTAEELLAKLRKLA